MRNLCLRILTLALGLLAFAGGSGRLHGQQYVELIKFTNTWRYNQSGANLGTAWIPVAYDDTQAGWSGGPALFGLESPLGGNYNEATITPNVIPTPLSLTSGGGSNGVTITYYFRTKFTNTLANLTGVALWATNLVDDGCVIYLNGVRVADVRLTNASPSYLTFANGGPGTEGQYDVESIPVNRLNAAQNSVNTMAVEVHQSGIGSSDVTFAMKLVAIVSTPLTITTQPQSVTAAVSEPVNFSIGVSGGPVVYRWYRNGALYPGGTNATLSFTAQQNLAGTFYCVISNSVTLARTSSIVSLTVVQDTSGPEPITATVLDTGATNIIQIQFNETILGTPDSRDTNNYRVIVSGTTNQFVAVTNVQLAGANVLLRVGTNNWVIGGNYYIVLNRIPDGRGFNCAPNTVVGISWNERRILSQMSDFWRFYDCADLEFCDANALAVYANEAWAKTNFVIGPTWGQGSAGGIYYRDPELANSLCSGDGLGQILNFQLEPTLFRKTFVITSSVPVSAQLRFRQMVDDGLVLYLNGQRIYSTNAPAGAVTISTRATATVGNATCVTNNSANAVTLLPGTNWLAAAVLNAGTAEADTTFGLEIEGTFQRTSPIPSTHPTNTIPPLLRMTQTRLPNNSSRISWPVSITQTSGFYGVSLMCRTNGTDSWLQVSNQSNPYTNTVSPRIFKLIRE